MRLRMSKNALVDTNLEKGSIEWNYYSGKDIEHGCLGFDGVVEYHTKRYNYIGNISLWIVHRHRFAVIRKTQV